MQLRAQASAAVAHPEPFAETERRLAMGLYGTLEAVERLMAQCYQSRFCMPYVQLHFGLVLG